MRAKLAAPIFAALLGVACSTAPVQEMSDARQAIDAAEAAAVGGDPPDELSRGRDLLHRAEQSLQQGDYRQARELAQGARSAAVTAREKALAAR